MKKIKQLKQAHGNIEKSNVVNTLDQILGDRGFSSGYNTSDEENYKSQLDEMNKSDLQTHAVRLGLVPVDNRQLLVNRLIKQFKMHWTKYNVSQGKLNTKEVVSKSAKDILAEGA